MEKIIKFALQTKFPNANLVDLMDVLNATGNAVVATEILLGIYDEPNIPEHAIVYNTPATLTSFNKYKEEVRYSTDTFTTKSLYFDSEELANECVEYDPSMGRDSYHRKPGDFRKEFQIPITTSNTTTLREWMEGAEKMKSIV